MEQADLAAVAKRKRKKHHSSTFNHIQPYTTTIPLHRYQQQRRSTVLTGRTDPDSGRRGHDFDSLPALAAPVALNGKQCGGHFRQDTWT
jgi:hypothetical protein